MSFLLCRQAQVLWSCTEGAALICTAKRPRAALWPRAPLEAAARRDALAEPAPPPRPQDSRAHRHQRAGTGQGRQLPSRPDQTEATARETPRAAKSSRTQAGRPPRAAAAAAAVVAGAAATGAAAAAWQRQQRQGQQQGQRQRAVDVQRAGPVADAERGSGCLPCAGIASASRKRFETSANKCQASADWSFGDVEQ